MFRRIGEYLTPDPRHAVEVLVNESTGAIRPMTFEDWYDNVSSLNLIEPVPENIVNEFDKSRNIFVLSWFAYDLTTAAELQAYLALEMALWTRLDIDPKNKNAPRLKKLLEMALAQGIYSAEDFRFGHLKGETPKLLIDMIVNQRNELSHGSNFLFVHYSAMALEICGSLIRALFGDELTT
jgi:hypothetical protein